MTFVISDIRGDYEKFIAMLKMIDIYREEGEDGEDGLLNFSDYRKKPVLYVLGDMIDGKAGSIRILQEIMRYDNILPIRGEHEQMAALCLPRISKKAQAEPDYALTEQDKKRLLSWQERGGTATIAEFVALSEEEQEDILDFLTDTEGMPFAYDVTVAKKRYVLMHTVKTALAGKAPEDYTAKELFGGKETLSPGENPFQGTTLITGHHRTGDLNPDYAGRILRTASRIHLNCAYTDENGDTQTPLGCLCLDSGKTIYVD